MKNTVLFAMTALFSVCALAEEYTVEQKDKLFVPEKLEVNVGDTIHFLNSDSFFHNVFSLSDTEMFDLGSYPQGKSKSVTFSTPGTVEVECAIHPDMFMTVDVK